MKYSELIWLGAYGFISGINAWSALNNFLEGDLWGGVIFTLVSLIFLFFIVWLAWMRYQDKEHEVLMAQTDAQSQLINAVDADDPVAAYQAIDKAWWERSRKASRIFPWSKVK